MVHSLILSGLALATAAASAADAVSLTAAEQDLANRLTGDKGQRRSTSEMVLDPILTSVARARAADMAKRRYFSHVDPDGCGPNYLARAAGYALPSGWGNRRSDNFVESIGAGYPTPSAAWEAWMRSAPHRTHLLASKSFYRNQTSFGIGVCFDPHSPFRTYWVIITAPPAQPVTTAAVQRGKPPAQVALQVPARSIRSAVASPKDTGALNSIPGVPRPTAEQATDRIWNWDASRHAVPAPAIRNTRPR